MNNLFLPLYYTLLLCCRFFAQLIFDVLSGSRIKNFQFKQKMFITGPVQAPHPEYHWMEKMNEWMFIMCSSVKLWPQLRFVILQSQSSISAVAQTRPTTNTSHSTRTIVLLFLQHVPQTITTLEINQKWPTNRKTALKLNRSSILVSRWGVYQDFMQKLSQFHRKEEKKNQSRKTLWESLSINNFWKKELKSSAFLFEQDR